MRPVQCPYCGNFEVDYRERNDGGGDDGTLICDFWHCPECRMDFETDCIEVHDEEE